MRAGRLKTVIEDRFSVSIAGSLALFQEKTKRDSSSDSISAVWAERGQKLLFGYWGKPGGILWIPKYFPAS